MPRVNTLKITYSGDLLRDIGVVTILVLLIRLRDRGDDGSPGKSMHSTNMEDTDLNLQHTCQKLDMWLHWHLDLQPCGRQRQEDQQGLLATTLGTYLVRDPVKVESDSLAFVSTHTHGGRKKEKKGNHMFCLEAF